MEDALLTHIPQVTAILAATFGMFVLALADVLALLAIVDVEVIYTDGPGTPAVSDDMCRRRSPEVAMPPAAGPHRRFRRGDHAAAAALARNGGHRGRSTIVYFGDVDDRPEAPAGIATSGDDVQRHIW